LSIAARERQGRNTEVQRIQADQAEMIDRGDYQTRPRQAVEAGPNAPSFGSRDRHAETHRRSTDTLD